MTRITEIIQSPIFARQKKKLHKNLIKDLDKAVKSIFQHPDIGVAKTGDLQGVQVFKFKSQNQQFLLAYEIVESTLYLYTFGSHENFYRALKKYLKE
ncbi:MAG TPA: type II toxin-antitoxin system RelE/ParE family toxin [Desulfotignum sp.]|jgi:mRNA interferase RelE/StbE|nr:type II toxin-antitoxin system RelE/ParE family toxin [Desulfotignum sp.]